ncbi:PQQ-binding-like beta-propeller repeat protein [Streptomyces sp. NPDC002730]|uniref:protein kinase domain-containing protein n=1 Tax=Streptomyces sp. NPDC002730 TaxID=3364662 RepID=UPI0036C3143D
MTHHDPFAIAAYRLIARLGSGGMGTVYLARSHGGRTVALKTMHAGIASDPASRTRFRLETDAARIIGGHHGATVVDADPLAETPWLATEYVLGPPLDDAVSIAGPLPEASVRALGAALAAALAQLHSSDVVHRDLKPSNVMVTAYGPKIIDFGIARAAGDDRLTRTGAAAGTPAFMSPEQATGQEHTPAGDLFALAGVLTYAATGHGPFGTGRPADLLYRVRYADPDLTGAPDALVPILTRCLSKDPTHRPTTLELAAQLHDGQGQFADHLPETLLTEIVRRASDVWLYQPHRLPTPGSDPYAATVPSPTSPGMTRRKLLTIGGGSILGTATAAFGAWTWLSNDAPDTSPTAPDTPSSTPPPRTIDPREAWRRTIKSEVTRVPPMAVGDSVVLPTDEGLLSLDATSGKQRWLNKDLKQAWQLHSDEARIYALLPGGSHGHQLSPHTVNVTNGRTTPLAAFGKFDKPVQQAHLLDVADGTLYLAARKGAPGDPGPVQEKSWHVMAVSLNTGKELWSTPLRSYRIGVLEETIVSARSGSRLVLCRKAATGNALEVSARDVRTGAELWKATVARNETDTSVLLPGELAVDGRHVYFGANEALALRLSDGSVAWRFGKGRDSIVTADARAYGTPAVKDGVVYVAEFQGGLVGLDASDGNLRWEEQPRNQFPALRIPPVIHGAHVFSSDGTQLGAVNLASYKKDWTFSPSPSSFVLHERAARLVGVGDDLVVAVRLDQD